MPSLVTAKLPEPKSWEEFEEIVADTMAYKWEDLFVVRNGRNGQKQNGVDVYGKQKSQEGYRGVQCRLGQITIENVRDEIAKAEQFKPPLKEFTFCTSTQANVKLQEEVRLIDESRTKNGKFGVRILFWQDICRIIASNTELAEKHFPQFIERASSIKTIYRKIMESSLDEWMHDDEKGVHVYKKDANLRLIRIDEESTDFKEPWLEKFPDQLGRTAHHAIYYGGTFVKKLHIVSIDGGRASIPYPSMENKTITLFQHKIGQILNYYDFQQMHWYHSFDHYLHRAGIRVDRTSSFDSEFR